MSGKGDGGGVPGVSRNFLQGGAAAPTSFPSLAHLVLGGSSRLLAGTPGQNRVDLGEVVMSGIWEVTLGKEGSATRQEIGLKPPKGPDRPWKWEPWSRAVWGQSGIPRIDPDPPRKARLSAPTCATETLLVPTSPGP